MTSPPVLYLHGLASSPSSTKAGFFRRRLARRGHEVDVPDLNEGDFHGLTTSRAVALAGRRLDALDAGAFIFGSSFGGRVAVHAAASRPRQVRALVLMAPALSMKAVWERTLGAGELARWRREGIRWTEHPAYQEKVALSYEFYENGLRTDRPPALAPGLPVLILHGSRDEVVPLEGSESFAARHHAARLVVLDSDHGLTDCMERLWIEVSRFLDEVSGPVSA